MLANIKEVITKFGSNINDLYKQLVTTTAEIENVRRYTKEAVEEFKRLLERQSDKIERIERDRIKAETELLTKIGALQSRLDAITEQTMRSAVSDYAKSLVDEAAKREAQKSSNPLLLEKKPKTRRASSTNISKKTPNNSGKDP